MLQCRNIFLIFLDAQSSFGGRQDSPRRSLVGFPVADMPSLGAWPSASAEVLQGEGRHSHIALQTRLGEITEVEGQIVLNGGGRKWN